MVFRYDRNPNGPRKSSEALERPCSVTLGEAMLQWQKTPQVSVAEPMDVYGSLTVRARHRSAGCSSRPGESLSALVFPTPAALALKPSAQVWHRLFLLTFHSPRQVTWSHLTSKVARKYEYHPAMCLKEEKWNSWEQPTERPWVKEPERWV